jgi:plastocyanin
MNKYYSGISVIAVAVVVLVVIVVAAASALYLIPSGNSTSTLITPSTTISQSQQSSLATTTSSSFIGFTSNSSSSTVSSTSTSSSIPSGQLLMEFTFPGTLVASSDLSSMNYTVNFHALGNVPANVSLKVEAPPGIVASLSPANLSLASVTSTNLEISSPASTPPGNYQFTLVASGGGATYAQNETVQVLKYLVVTLGSNFVPKNLTVSQGSTVTWLRLNGVISQYDNGDHNVVFSSGISTVSPTLDQYATWTYNFGQTGNYSYYCKYHPFMTGEVSVVA